MSPYAPSEYEKSMYYNGITVPGDQPDLLYRSDFLENPFPEPQGSSSSIPSRSARGVFNTPLNQVWDTVGPQIRDLIKANNIKYSCINPARFVIEKDDVETLGPVVIWVAVHPNSTSPDTAHKVSQDILALLVQNGVKDVVVEWHEAVVRRLIDSVD